MRERSGVCARLLLREMGTVREPEPVLRLTLNFSPMPLIAPPPFGREIGAVVGEVSSDSEELCPCPGIVPGGPSDERGPGKPVCWPCWGPLVPDEREP